MQASGQAVLAHPNFLAVLHYLAAIPPRPPVIVCVKNSLAEKQDSGGVGGSLGGYANTRGTSAHRVVYSGVLSDCFIRHT